MAELCCSLTSVNNTDGQYDYNNSKADSKQNKSRYLVASKERVHYGLSLFLIAVILRKIKAFTLQSFLRKSKAFTLHSYHGSLLHTARAKI